MLTKFFDQKKILSILTFAFPVILYLNTIPNEYALDDSIAITENSYVKEGIPGIKKLFTNDAFTGFFKEQIRLFQGGRYRPFTLSSYAIEYSLWKENPHLSHLINVLLYGLICYFLFIFLKKLLQYLNYESLAIPVAFISSLLFAFHPVHTEVVANIKGRDELFVFLFGLMSLNLFLIYLEKDKIIYAVLSGVSVFLGLLSKENEITIVVIAILIITLNYKKDFYIKYFKMALIICVGIVIYLIMHHLAVGDYSKATSDELLNNPFVNAQKSQKLPTVLYTLLIYIKLLIYPNTLTYDYYPYHIQLQVWQNPIILFSATFHILLMFTAFYCFTRNKIISFGIFFYLITLFPQSNILINIGSFMNERFIFISSLGFCLLSGYAIYYLYLKFDDSPIIRKSIFGAYLIILILFGYKTILRNTQWKDNLTLFLHDVKISYNSAKGNCSAGGILYEKAKSETDTLRRRIELNSSINYLNTSLRIYPNYVQATLLLGNAYYLRDKDYNKTLSCYNKIFAMSPDDDLAFNNLKIVLSSANDIYFKMKGYHSILKYRFSDFTANYQLGVIYGRYLNKLDTSVIYLTRATIIKPDSKEANRDLGVALAMIGKKQMALTYFEKTLQLDPKEPANYVNVGITYEQLGDKVKANEYFRKAEELKKNH